MEETVITSLVNNRRKTLLGSLYKFPVLTLIITLETMVMGNMAIP